VADVAALSMLAGQMIGRVGCIVNGCAYGIPTSLPWGFIYVKPGAMIPAELMGMPTHPYPVYEMLWNGALLIGLWLWRKRAKPDGVIFATYVGLYALGRFVLTFVRNEREVLLGLQQAQVIALGAMAGAVSLMVYLRTKASLVPDLGARGQSQYRAGRAGRNTSRGAR
jgi:phosphatidylglycerol:prolipoprotein diacylglycerol transferase